jgi:hypothetical protein
MQFANFFALLLVGGSVLCFIGYSIDSEKDPTNVSVTVVDPQNCPTYPLYYLTYLPDLFSPFVPSYRTSSFERILVLSSLARETDSCSVSGAVVPGSCAFLGRHDHRHFLFPPGGQVRGYHGGCVNLFLNPWVNLHPALTAVNLFDRRLIHFTVDGRLSQLT